MTEEKLNNTVIIKNDLYKEIIKLKNEPGRSILIFGSPSVSQFLMHLDLIDNYWIFINPAIFGNGIPLFKESTKKTQLKLVATKRFVNGEIALNYLVIR